MSNQLDPTPNYFQDLDGNDFKAAFTRAGKAELLDVRTPGEFASGSIPGAKNLDMISPSFKTTIAKLDKGKEYFVFCRSGNRSGSACQLLFEKGLKAYNLQGGIGAWPR
ncbi:rhodanese-like domain-containing protein [Rufibacter hautae]|uniref:Rhodanese-like domain-containing protein n=1 Tax=Rufibacter hautae TaxID=2595005 RepID=A0A5B6TDV4_9BACT|nr:rhodanese-like domain-containing protein [Rufibacter hautae]KAA3437111.1 rhodanese-like domain-containing protein [Rufibacter hautae]